LVKSETIYFCLERVINSDEATTVLHAFGCGRFDDSYVYGV